MPALEWKTAWETGHPEIDRQHRELIQQLERLLTALAEGWEADETVRALVYLGDYVEFHFAAEEAEMAKIDYPRLVDHKAIHDGLRAQVKKLIKDYRGDPHSIPASVAEFLVGWLKTHLSVEDQLMAAHLRAAANK